MTGADSRTGDGGQDGRFVVRSAGRAGQPLIVLEDRQAQATATLAPGLGFSCLGFRVPTPDGPWAVLAEPPDDEALVHRTMRYGMPILFPWPNRVQHGRFAFAGTQHQLPLPDDAPHANHGLARDRAWTVAGAGATSARAFCRASVELGGDVGDDWPFPVRLTIEYGLADRTLRVDALAENIGDRSLPMGLGFHPWFDLPLGPGGTRESCELRVPAAAYWELDALIPTGHRRPVSGPLDRRTWGPLSDVTLDDVFTDLDTDGGWFTAGVRDPANGRAVAVRSDVSFREHVVFAPSIRSVLCLEPYTCATDAMNLADRGIDAHLIVLGPGESWRGSIEIIASAAAPGASR